MSDEPDQSVESPPVLSVVRGNPSDAELAAVLAVVASGSADRPEATRTAASGGSGWSAYWRAVRAPLAPGPDAWRMSGRT